MALRELKHLPREVVGLIKKEIVPHIPTEDRLHFFTMGLPATLQHSPSLEHWQSIAQILPHIPKQHRWRFFAVGLPLALELGLTSAESQQQVELAKHYLATLGSTYFVGKVVAENFGKLAPPSQTVNRLTFKKSDSALIPLGGKLAGHLIRIVKPSAFQAWKKAHAAGISVEPIDRSYTIKNGPNKGLVRVYTHAVGEMINLHLEQNPQHRKELERQKQEILWQLAKHKIRHGDTHDRNFTVTMKNNKPALHLIDLDRATSQ